MKINLKELPYCSLKTRQRFRQLIKFGMRVSLFYTILTVCSVQLLLAHHEGLSQGIESIYVTVELKNETLKTLFDKIEEQTNVRFTYFESEISGYTNINIPKEQRSIKYLLDEVIGKGTLLTYSQVGDNYVIIRKKENNELTNPPNDSMANANADSPFFTVTGTVTDAGTQQTLPGVNVIVKGTTRGTTTDAVGKFSIDAEDNDVLVFSFIGFKTFEAQVNGRTLIDVSMEGDITALNEVVVNAGYYNVKDRERTGNISRVTAKEINNQPVVNPLQTIYGRVPGVYIQQSTGVPGGGFNIKIRGQNSLRTIDNNGVDANAPLYVIDGVPFSFESLSSTSITGGILGTTVSPLNAINPADIEAIEILKDADATAIYGSRGANGVILITTKRGSAGKTKVELNINTGVGRVARSIDFLNTKEYLEMRNEAFANDNKTPGASDYDVNGTWDQSRYTDWQKVLLGGTSKSTMAQLSLSGGAATTRFLFGGTFRKETTVFPGDSRYLKGSTHFSVNHTSPNNRLKANLSINYTADDNNQPGIDLTSSALGLAPNAPRLYQDDGSLNWENSTWDNPLAQLEQIFSNKTNTLLSNAVLGYEILPGLEVKTNLGLTNQQSKEILKVPHTAYNPAYGLTSAASQAYYSSGDLKNWIIEPQVSWGKKIALGRLELLMGTTFQNQVRESSVHMASGFSSNSLMDNPLAAATYSMQSYSKSIYRYNAFFGRINYNWDGKYILNITGRRDGSSRFGPGKQFANFGAVGVAWIFSNENFIRNNLSILSFGKVRTSYGTTGNDQIGDYRYLNAYSPSLGYQGTSGLSPVSLFNPDFAWEVNKKFEVALDLGFFQDRIYLSASYYQNRSSSQLIEYSLPLTTGFSSILSNFPATVQNRGLELEFRTTNIKKNSIEWTTSINITVPRNKLIAFPGLESSSYSNQYIVGKSLYLKKVYHHLGVDPVTGLHKIEDYNGDGVITSGTDQQYVVEMTQQYYGGINNSIKFKRFQLDFLFQFVKQTGQNIFWQSFLPGRVNRNEPKYVLERWQSEGDETNFQRFALPSNSAANSTFNRYRGSNAGFSDASFMRLRNLSLSYTLPSDLIPGINGSVYLQAQNLLTITNYKGLDPEIQSNSRIPPLRIISIGVQLGL